MNFNKNILLAKELWFGVLLLLINTVTLVFMSFPGSFFIVPFVFTCFLVIFFKLRIKFLVRYYVLFGLISLVLMLIGVDIFFHITLSYLVGGIGVGVALFGLSLARKGILKIK